MERSVFSSAVLKCFCRNIFEKPRNIILWWGRARWYETRHVGPASRIPESKNLTEGATIFGYYVNDPRPFGVVEFDEDGKAVSIEEKPAHPKSNFIVPGLYFYDNEVVNIASGLKPSARGELEITSVNNAYLEKEQLHVIPLDEGYSWFDAGNADSLYDAAGAIKAAQRSGKMIACLKEIAVQNHWITIDQLKDRADKMSKTKYDQYLEDIYEEMVG